jgi:uncharacterized membrane protein
MSATTPVPQLSSKNNFLQLKVLFAVFIIIGIVALATVISMLVNRSHLTELAPFSRFVVSFFFFPFF